MAVMARFIGGTHLDIPSGTAFAQIGDGVVAITDREGSIVAFVGIANLAAVWIERLADERP